MMHPVHVLIVDDEPLIRLNLRALMEDLGFHASEAANGSEALALIEQELPDLVLTDLRMPEMDGLTLIRALRVSHPDTPVIVVSGTGSIRDAMEAIRNGAWDYITKPVDEQETFEIVINRTLERSRLVRENRRYGERLEDLVRERTEELHDSETRYRRLLESVTSYVYTTTFRGGMPVQTVHHHGCEALTGFTPEEYAADPDLWFRMVYEEDRQLVLDMTQRIPDATAPVKLDHRLITKNGSLRWVQSTLVPHRDAQGRFLSYDGIITDISERKQIEETQSFLLTCGNMTRDDDFFASLARYLGTHLHMDLVCIDILEWDSLSARTLALYCDGEFQDNVTYTLQDTPCGEVVGKAICCFPQGVRHLFPQDTVLQEMQAESYAGVTLWSSQGIPIGLIAVIGRQPLEAPQLASSTLQLVAVRAAGELERRQAEESLRKLSRAVEQSPVSIVITDTQGTVEFVNPKFSQITGYEREEALGQNLRILKTGHTPREEYQRLWGTISTGNVWEGEFQNKKRNGELFWEHATISPIRNREGDISNYLAIKEDITERKRLEEQLRQSQKMEAIGLLAGGVAHDFNNILTVIMGYGNMLLMQLKPDNPMKEMIDQILSSAERAAHLTSSLLAFSHKQVMNPKLCDLNDIVNNIQKFLNRVIGEDIQLKIAVANEQLKILADSGQMEQLLVNLATNARDAMPKGGLLSIETSLQVVDTAFVQAHGYGAPGRYALVTVTDTGCGMDEATRNRIFEPFFTTKEMGKGTGLGMAIVYGIVKQHKGYIDVDSDLGKGCSFKVYTPLVEPGHEANGQVADAVPPKPGTETILVAEDDAIVSQLIKTILTEFGYTVILAKNGQDAVEQYRAHREEIKLVLMDMIMPVMNGREASERIKLMQPDVKILFTSGYTVDIVRSRGDLEEGAELIMKPVQPLGLVRKVREILDRH